MNDSIDKVRNLIGNFRPSIALIFGSGLKDACPDMKKVAEISYEEIGFPKSTVKGHGGKLIFGEYKGVKIVVAGRLHYYESGDLSKVALPFELLSRLGVKDVILTSSSGGVSDKVKAGDLMIIKDHVNFAPNPLIGRPDQKFISLFNLYDEEYRKTIKKISTDLNIEILEGIHAQVTGPSYETVKERELLNFLGIDTVSMSMAYDAILCRFFDMKVLAFTAICNMSGGCCTHEEVLQKSKNMVGNLKILISKFIEIKFNGI
jgi:purine-nucleoside phosphorylase